VSSAAGDDKKEIPSVDAQFDSFGATKNANRDEFARIVLSWKELPTFLLAGLVDELAERAAKNQSDTFREPFPLAAIERRDTVPGRAMWAIEQLTGTQFKNFVSKTDRTAIEPREILLFARGFKCGMLASSIDSSPREQEVDRLREIFNGKMTEGTSRAAFDSGPQFERFLNQWRPIGKKPSEIVAITGLKGKWNEETSTLRFVFESGFAGEGFSLEVIGDRIASVQRFAIY